MKHRGHWLVGLGNRTWSASDLTGRHLLYITAALERDTWDFDPRSGPRNLIAVLAAFAAIELNRPHDLVLAEISALPLQQLLAALTTVDRG